MTVKASSAQEKRSSFNQSSSQNRLSIDFFDIISSSHKFESDMSYYFDRATCRLSFSLSG